MPLLGSSSDIANANVTNLRVAFGARLSFSQTLLLGILRAVFAIGHVTTW